MGIYRSTYTYPTYIHIVYLRAVYFWHETKLRNERNLIFMFIISHSCGLALLWGLFDCFIAVCFDCVVRVCFCVCVMDIIAVTCIVKTINYGHLRRGNAVKTL